MLTEVAFWERTDGVICGGQSRSYLSACLVWMSPEVGMWTLCYYSWIASIHYTHHMLCVHCIAATDLNLNGHIKHKPVDVAFGLPVASQFYSWYFSVSPAFPQLTSQGRCSEWPYKARKAPFGAHHLVFFFSSQLASQRQSASASKVLDNFPNDCILIVNTGVQYKCTCISLAQDEPRKCNLLLQHHKDTQLWYLKGCRILQQLSSGLWCSGDGWNMLRFTFSCVVAENTSPKSTFDGGFEAHSEICEKHDDRGKKCSKAVCNSRASVPAGHSFQTKAASNSFQTKREMYSFLINIYTAVWMIGAVITENTVWRLNRCVSNLRVLREKAKSL